MKQKGIMGGDNDKDKAEISKLNDEVLLIKRDRDVQNTFGWKYITACVSVNCCH